MEKLNFFKYWDSFGLFDNIHYMLPSEFVLLFELARVLYAEETSADAFDAIEEIASNQDETPRSRRQDIDHNRVDRQAPIGNKLEIEHYKTIHDLKKALPKELAYDDDIFNAKLFTKTLHVQKYYESEYDSINPVTTARDSNKDANQFDQKFYILLDKSRSMDLKMRSFYSKCIVAEFLRRKLGSRAKLFFRSFDSVPGALFKIEKKSDFPRLLEEVILTVTGGSSTNMQSAIFQAIKDIRYDKDLQHSEILVITDGISKIDTDVLKERLGDIQLNILKIGNEQYLADYYEMQEKIKKEEVTFDQSVLNVPIKSMNQLSQDEDLTPVQKKSLRFLQDYSNKKFTDLASISKKFIEIDDIDQSVLYRTDPAMLKGFGDWIQIALASDYGKLMLDTKVKMYKQAYTLSQYIALFLKNNYAEKPLLKMMQSRLLLIKQKLLRYPDVFYIIEGLDNLEKDRGLIRNISKEMISASRDIDLTDSGLTMDTIAASKVSNVSAKSKSGSKGRSFFVVLLVKLIQVGKKIIKVFSGDKTAND